MKAKLFTGTYIVQYLFYILPVHVKFSYLFISEETIGFSIIIVLRR